MTVNREAATEAVTELMRGFQTNALQNGLIWRFVNAALDAAEIEITERQAATHFVVLLGAEPVYVARTKREARWARRYGYPGARIRKVIS